MNNPAFDYPRDDARSIDSPTNPTRPVLNRRAMGACSLAAIGTGTLAAIGTSALDRTPAWADDVRQSDASPGWIRKSLKLNMIGTGDSLEAKFAIAKSCGFEGVEPNLPIDPKTLTAMKTAATNTGLIVDGSVGGYHWKIRHTDPSADVRDEAATLLRRGIEQTAELGGDTFLLVPGRGDDGDPEQTQRFAIDAIEGVLESAKSSGVVIAIENVWNRMFYDPDGGSNQTADALARFVDAFDSGVGVQFDLGNHWKFGDVAGWVRTLGDRIVKLDIKGFNRQSNRFTKINESDIDWQSVRAALAEIGFTGWAAAEVRGGDAERLREVANAMENTLRCSSYVTAER